MKVYEGQGPLLPQNNKTTPKKGSEGTDFQKIMDQAKSQTGHKGVIAHKENVGSIPEGVQIIHRANRPDAPVDIQEKKQLLDNLKETLDIIDFYAKKLRDRSFSVTGITPLVSHLEDRLNTLKDVESSPRTPEKLRPIVSDMVITIGTEVAKFKRGDYV